MNIEIKRKQLLDFLKTLDSNIIEITKFSLKEENDLDGLAYEHIKFECSYKIFHNPSDKTLDINYLISNKKGLIRRHDFLMFINSKQGNKPIWDNE